METRLIRTTHHHRDKLVRDGHAIAISRGLYLSQEATPRELATLLTAEFPGLFLAGRSAAQLVLGEELTYPLEVASKQRIAPSPYLTSRRIVSTWHVGLGGFRVHLPLLTARFIEDDAIVQAFFEKAYAGRDGHDRLNLHLEKVGRLPRRIRDILNASAIGTDSGAEVKVVRALRAQGIKVVTNHQIGPYYWDIAIPAWKVAIEIDSHEFHSQLPHFVRDRWKNNDATLRGWTTLRYSGSCVANHFPAVIQQITEARTPNFAAYFFDGVWRWHEIFLRMANPEEGELLGFDR